MRATIHRESAGDLRRKWSALGVFRGRLMRALREFVAIRHNFNEENNHHNHFNHHGGGGKSIIGTGWDVDAESSFLLRAIANFLVDEGTRRGIIASIISCSC